MFTYPIILRVPLRHAVSPDGRRIEHLHDEFHFQVRGITRAEYKSWTLQHPDRVDLEERVLAEAVVSHPPTFHDQPWDWDQLYFGVAHQLVNEILAISGYGGGPHPTLTARVDEYFGGEESKYDLLILTAMPYTIEQLMEMEPEMWHLAVRHSCEKLWRMGIDPDSILNPEAYEKKTKRAQALARAQAGANPSQYMGRGVQVSHQNQQMSFTGE
jgi:hypothetical protein